MAVGIGRAALDEAAAFAREHDLGGDPRVRDRLERTRRKLRAARLLCWRAAWLADQQQPNMVEASMAKAHAPAGRARGGGCSAWSCSARWARAATT